MHERRASRRDVRQLVIYAPEIAAKLLLLYPPRAGDRHLRRGYTAEDIRQLPIDVLLARIDKQVNYAP